MEEKLGALFPLQDLVSELDAQHAQFDDLTVLGNLDGNLRELMILPIQLIVEVEKLKHLLVDGTPAPSICL